jgi:putative ATPase
VTLIAADTENPFFSVISRCCRASLLTARAADRRITAAVIERARSTNAGLDARSTDDAASTQLVRTGRGDARRGSPTSKAASYAPRTATASDTISLEHARDCRRIEPRCATTAKGTSTTTSSAHSSSRFAAATSRCALHYLARMIAAGRDPRFIARPAGDPGQPRTSGSRTHRVDDRGCGGASGAADRDARGPAESRPGRDRAGSLAPKSKTP